jgi:hypothetical protein
VATERNRLGSFWLFGNWPIRLRSGQGLIGFELGLFLYPASGIKFDNPLYNRYLRSFELSRNWVCLLKKSVSGNML